MDMNFLNDFTIPVIVGICLIVGYIAKKWINDLDNRYIPTLCAVVGLILSVWMGGWSVTPEIILQGAFSGLAATGLHQAFKQFVEKREG